ncbi:MAG: sigma-54-dependent Fis family transcriptional regulator [Calditrichaeota bacterium]|nr:sigma-54-dependent Fis family transcriptional regulator [Calditrichota bacterium]RQV92792.1 MAG: sigma-54-dependent Fis family transcriptional regulator [bacterium]RQW00535.1 MAG: sigma-54-dependent Fis family transcriptional regulator [Calditrichota bacterium]
MLVVDDEQSSLNAINRILRQDFDVLLSKHAEAALEILKNQEVTVLLADQRMPDISGVELFQKSLQIQPDATRILITGYTDIEAIIQAINQGKIYYYISKPWEPEDLRLIIHRGVERYSLIKENQRLVDELKTANEKLRQENIILHQEAEKKYEFENIIGQSEAMEQVFQMIRKAIPTDITVLLRGETGTGKELIARAIHYNGPRRDKLFVAQNCSALPETLLESELFGHTRGAFTGASRDKRGLFEVADGGTVFLDEIADTSAALQQRLLRVIQEGEIRPLGSERTIKVDVRIISATNKDLEQAVKNGEFREDLYYRLNVFPVRIPPLRERRDDIPILVEHFIQKYSEKQRKNIKGIENDALDILLAGSFPGNVRELENEIQRAITLADNNSFITADLLSPRLKGEHTPMLSFIHHGGNLKEIVESLEKYYITRALEHNDGNITHSARELGLSRVGLQKKMHRYKIKAS